MINRIIDAHCLVGMDYWLSRNKDELGHKNDLVLYESCLKKLARSYMSVIMPFPSSEDGSYLSENQYVLDLHYKYDWTIPVLAFNPYSEKNVKYVSEKLENKEVKGIVLWPVMCKLDLDRLKENDSFDSVLKNYKPWVTVHVAAGNEKMIQRVTRLNNCCPSDAISLAGNYPEIKFNLSHLLRISDKALSEAEYMDNIMIDISGISMHKRWFEYGINVFPAVDCNRLKEYEPVDIIQELMNNDRLNKKLVFGTQYPFDTWSGYDVEKEVALVKKAGLDKGCFDQIMYKNFDLFMSEVYDGKI